MDFTAEDLIAVKFIVSPTNTVTGAYINVEPALEKDILFTKTQ